jgi:vitamin B12 transporter
LVRLIVFLQGMISLNAHVLFDSTAVLNKSINKGTVKTAAVSSDTLQLGEVEVFSPALDKYSFGQQIKSISSDDLQDYQGLGLSDFLQQRTGLFLRQYGAGMLATLTLRGTSAGHNAVFWNGLPINSLSLGQTDFSVLPIVGFDEVSLHFGSGGALFGTDAIGGSVHLNSKMKFGQGHNFQYGGQIGSFGRLNNQVQYGYSNEKVSLRTRVYRNYAENNFPYRNLAKHGTPIERQDHASFNQVGINQDLALQLSSNQLLSSSVWYNQSDREIQPVIGSNTLDKQQDRNLRWVLDYFRFSKNKTWNLKTGIVQDELMFNSDNNRTLQFFLIGDVDWEISDLISSKTGIRYTGVKGELSAYTAQEDRFELYHSTNFSLRENVHISVNLRQLIYDGKFAPFTPSLGAEWQLLSNDHQEIKLKATGARSFKIPTLNDRFWEPGGNAELLSESSWSGEVGLSHLWKNSNITVSQQLTHYRMWVDNWIIWLPRGNFWTPENVRSVHNKGLEYFFDADYRLGFWGVSLQGNYNWTQAINKTNISENDQSAGNQLPYTPVHKFQSLIGLKRGAWSSYFNFHFTGSRFVGTDNLDVLSAYQLLDWGIKVGEIKTSRIKGTIGFQVNNLFNTSYQVLRLRAMPGRNYQMNIQITL